MEYLNKIELKGIVWQVDESHYTTRAKRFTIMVEDVMTSKEGETIIQRTWFNAVAFDQVKGYETIEKDKPIHIKGRIKMFSYEGPNGRTPAYQILVQEII